MTRSLRNREHPAPNPVSSYPVAPDHYNDPKHHEKFPYHDTWREFLESSVPYRAGDVVYVQHGDEARKAYISHVWAEHDHMDFLREKYRVHLANKTGDRFAKNWFYTWPGFIERGYQMVRQEQPV